MNKQNTFTDFVIQLCLWTLIISTPIHEYGHLLAVRLVGGEGAVYSYDLDAMHWVNLPDMNHLWFVYLGGGLFAFIVFMVAYWKCCDWELRFCFLFNGSLNLFYGIGECVFHARETLLSTITALPLALFIVYWFMLRE